MRPKDLELESPLINNGFVRLVAFKVVPIMPFQSPHGERFRPPNAVAEGGTADLRDVTNSFYQSEVGTEVSLGTASPKTC